MRVAGHTISQRTGLNVIAGVVIAALVSSCSATGHPAGRSRLTSPASDDQAGARQACQNTVTGMFTTDFTGAAPKISNVRLTASGSPAQTPPWHVTGNVEATLTPAGRQSGSFACTVTRTAYDASARGADRFRVQWQLHMDGLTGATTTHPL